MHTKPFWVGEMIGKADDATASRALEVRLLGPFDVLVGGKPVDVRGAKRQTLVAYLALRARREVAADALIEALWGSDLPAAPRNAVQHHVTRLRRALGPDAIRLAADGYALEGAVVDALQFEELLVAARTALRAGDARSAAEMVEEALDLWRGSPLLGLPESRWVSAEAARLNALRTDALEERFEAALALGEQGEIVSAVRAAIEETPFRERLWGQLMLALYRSGRQADALETFQEARAVLMKEFGLEPGPELQRLQQAILAHDPAIAPVAPRRRGNLPAPVTSFVGREEDLSEVLRLLSEHRLVTVTGPPGVGKSRVALEAMRLLESEVRDGVWLVGLSRARGPEDVARVAAEVLGGTGTSRGGDALERVLARLRAADEAIVILDSCELVIEGARRVAAAMLEASAGVRVLATSRQLLDINGEAQHRLSPLGVPEADAELDELGDSEAVQLYVERARAARPTFEPGGEDARLAAEICRRLDGLPLAIELAAARMNVFGLAELLSVFERRLALLLEPDRKPTDATRAVETLVAWSYDLLHADEKTLLHQVAVHRGGAPLPALVATGDRHGLDETTVIQLLGALVDKSIVTVSFPDGEARYGMLDTVREYALGRLAEAGGLAAAQLAHAEYFATLAETAHAQLRGADWQACIRRLELEHDNLWSALTYAREAGDGALGIRLAGPLGWYFSLAERVSEGRRFLEAALAEAPDDEPVGWRIELLGWLTFLATEELDLETAIDVGERGLKLAESVPPSTDWTPVWVSLALAFSRSGDHDRAAATADRGCAAADAADDDWGRSLTTLVRAGVAAAAGDIATAADMTEKGRKYAEAIGYDAFLPAALLFEAWVAERFRDGQSAAEAYGRAYEVSRRAGFREHASVALSGLGSVALAGGDLKGAEELFRRAHVVAEAEPLSWPIAHARARLADVLAAGGDARTAERLYRNVVEWSEGQRPHRARETQFLPLTGSPGAAALLGLAQLAEGRGETALADDLRERAATRAELDGAPLQQAVTA